jgi:hypothetical protein
MAEIAATPVSAFMFSLALPGFWVSHGRGYGVTGTAGAPAPASAATRSFS